MTLLDDSEPHYILRNCTLLYHCYIIVVLLLYHCYIIGMLTYLFSTYQLSYMLLLF